VGGGNAIDEQVAKIIKRPMTAGHLGEWLAAKISGIELEPSAVTAPFDGRFTARANVNVKWYLKREGLLDLTESEKLDCYLELTGPASAAPSSRGATRPRCIQFAPGTISARRPAGPGLICVASELVPGRRWRAAHPRQRGEAVPTT
jgi:hypothetical protein